MRPYAAQRPTADEFGAPHAGYIERVPVGDVIETLIRQTDAVRAALATVSDERASERPGPAEWSGKQVLGHITEWERVFCYRALCFARSIDVDLPGYDQEAMVAVAGFDGRSWVSLLTEHAAVRAATIMLFDGLQPADWDRGGQASGIRITVRAIAYWIAGHELHHVASLRDVYGLLPAE